MISSPANASSRFPTAFFAGALAFGATLLIAAGPAPQLIYPSDDAAYLDACQRASLGQWMGRDFSSPIGPAALLPTALAMKLGGATVNALVVGSALTWLAFGLLAWFTARPRMPAWLAAAFALFVAATAAAPYTLDAGSWRILSYGMLYNRLAWAALCVAAAAAILPRTDDTAPWMVPSGLGICAVWLWTLKPNYLVALAPLILYQWLSSPGRGGWLARAAVGAMGALLGVWLCVRFSPTSYIETHLGMAREAPLGLLTYPLSRSLHENFWLVFALGAIWAVALKNFATAPVRCRLGFALGAVMAATFVANIANCQFSEIPLWGALGWLGAAWMARATPVTWFVRLILFAGVVLGLVFTWQPLASMGYSLAWNLYRAPGSPAALRVASAAWQSMPMRPFPGELSGPEGSLEFAGNYAAWLNDGLTLLSQIRPPRGAVLCLDWINPFPFATQTAPALGDEIAWHVGRTVGASHHPDIARLLAASSVVMEPRRSIQPDSLAFKRALFGPALQASFAVAGETEHWRAWVRRNAGPLVCHPGH